MKNILFSISIFLLLTNLSSAQSLKSTDEPLARLLPINLTHSAITGLAGDKCQAYREGQEKISVMDSIHAYIWDNNLKEWNKYLRFFYSYDGNGNETQVVALYLLPESNVWVNYIMYQYTLDEQGNRVEELNQAWDTASSDWVNVYKHFFAYDESDNRLEEVAYAWDAAGNNWKESYKFVYTYDDAGNMLSQTSYGWDSDLANWKVSWKYISTYDDEKLMEKIYFIWNPNSEEWGNNQQFIYAYNEEGQMSNYICYNWDSSMNDWVKSYKYGYTYGDENVSTRYTWNVDTEEWVATSITNYSFDENGNMISSIYKNWNVQLNEWVNSNRYDYFWSDIEGIEEEDVLETFMVFPNPAKGTIYITSNKFTKSSIQIKILNLKGQSVYSNTMHSLNKEFSIKLPQLPDDLYLLQIRGKDFFIVKKIIIR